MAEKRKLLVFEKKILRNICGQMKDEGPGEWRERKNYELERFWKENILV